jgi:metallo-beta-lactamase family protein
MCTGGRIVGHLQELLPRPETCVLFVGYQAAGTPGRAIQAARPGDRVRIDGEDVPVRASIETLPGLSAHADRSELLRWVRALPETRRLALHHGEPTQQTGFRDWASGELAASPTLVPSFGRSQ